MHPFHRTILPFFGNVCFKGKIQNSTFIPLFFHFYQKWKIFFHFSSIFLPFLPKVEDLFHFSSTFLPLLPKVEFLGAHDMLSLSSWKGADLMNNIQNVVPTCDCSHLIVSNPPLRPIWMMVVQMMRCLS